MASCCDYSAGMLRTPVAFTRATLSSDGAGGEIEAWSDVPGAPTRAYIRPTGGSDRYASDRVENLARFLIVIRYNADLLPGDRVTFKGQALNIRAIRNVEMADKWLEIDAEAGVAS